MSRGIGKITTAVVTRSVNQDLSPLWTAIDNKVTKIDGKGLSTNDLTNELLAKVNTPYLKLNSTTKQTVNSDVEISKDLYITGNVYQQGKTYTTDVEELRVSDNLIITRNGATTAVTPYTGIRATKYDGTNDGLLVFDANGTAYVGDDPGDNTLTGLQALATRVNSIGHNGIAYWDNTSFPVLKSKVGSANGQVLSWRNSQPVWETPSFGLDQITFDMTDSNWSEIATGQYAGYFRYSLPDQNFYPLLVFKEYTDPTTGDIHYSEVMVQLEKKKGNDAAHNGVYFVAEKKIKGILIGMKAN